METPSNKEVQLERQIFFYITESSWGCLQLKMMLAVCLQLAGASQDDVMGVFGSAAWAVRVYTSCTSSSQNTHAAWTTLTALGWDGVASAWRYFNMAV